MANQWATAARAASRGRVEKHDGKFFIFFIGIKWIKGLYIYIYFVEYIKGLNT